VRIPREKSLQVAGTASGKNHKVVNDGCKSSHPYKKTKHLWFKGGLLAVVVQEKSRAMSV